MVGSIIVDEGKGRLNTTIRRFFFARLRKFHLETVLISQFDSESDKLAYLLKQAVREVLYTAILPQDFMETLIVYISYKFAIREKSLPKGVGQTLAGQLSTSKYSSCIKKLDSADFDRQIVLNDEPIARPLLEENIIPLLGIQTAQFISKKFDSDGDRLNYLQQISKFTMDWIGRICDDKVRIVWIGYAQIYDYLRCLKDGDIIKSFNFFIFGARRDNIDILDYFVTTRLITEFKEYVFSISDVRGEWVRKSHTTDFKWFFCEKTTN